MRFDLEIPPLNNTKLVYIPEGNDINSFLTPLAYVAINTKDVFISDFISAEEAFAVKEFSAEGFEIKNGPSFDITSDKILLTHISKFSSTLGVEVPLFYKHIIYETITPDTIKIIDYYGLEVDKSDYTIEVFNNKTFIYMNKPNNILFVEYVSSSKFKKTLIDLVPVFQEATWENLAINGSISDFEFTINNSVLSTNFLGKLFLSYINNIKMFKKPSGNIDDSWNVKILNSNFVVDSNGSRNIYTTPEFYRQRFEGSDNLRFIEDKKCYKIFPDIIKSQYEIASNMYDSVFVYIKDFYSGTVKYAFTTNSFYFNTEYKDGIYYSQISNLTNDGYIYLPVQLEDGDIATATHYTKEDYFTYTSLNLNSPIMSNNTYCAFFIKPNVLDTDSGIGHAIIGDYEEIPGTTDGDNVPINGYFPTYQLYKSYIDSKNIIHIALTTVSSFIESDTLTMFEARQQEGRMLNKLDSSKTDVDVIYNDIINKDLILPTNDSLIAKLKTSRLVDENKFEFDVDGEVTDVTSLAFVDLIKDKLNKNLDISTKAILKID